LDWYEGFISEWEDQTKEHIRVYLTVKNREYSSFSGGRDGTNNR